MRRLYFDQSKLVFKRSFMKKIKTNTEFITMIIFSRIFSMPLRHIQLNNSAAEMAKSWALTS